MADSLVDVIRQAGTALPVPGYDPLVVDRPERVWLVTEGTVEVFLAPGEEGAKSGGRRFLFAVGEGALLFGLDDPGAEEGDIVGVGVDATVVELGRDQVEQLLARPAHLDAAVSLLEQWVCTVAGFLADDVPAGRYTALRPGDTETLDDEELLYAREGVCWTRVERGTCALMGRSSLDWGDGDVLPLAEQLWARATSPGTAVEGRATGSLLGEGTLFEAMSQLHRYVLREVVRRSEEKVAQEQSRLQDRVDRDAEEMDQSLTSLARVLDPGTTGSMFDETAPNDPLLAACQIVGEELGVSMTAPASVRAGKQHGHRVEAIAEASKVRTRTVLLRGAWWTEDNGPLLAFRKDSGAPVALLQETPGDYRCYDPAEQTVEPVTREMAERLEPQARMFIVPFPEDELSVGTLWRFGARGLSGDLRTILVAGLMTGILGLATPILAKILIDRVIPASNRGGLVEIAALLGIFAVVAGLFQLTRGIAVLRVEAQLELNLEAAIMDRVLRLPATFFRQFESGDLAERVLGVTSIRRIVTSTTLTSVLTGVFSMVNLGLLFYYDVTLALVGLGLAAGALVILVWSGAVALRYNREIVEREGEISGLLLQLLSGISKLRVAGAERRAFSEWADQFAAKKRLGYRAGAIENNFEIFHAAYPIFTSIVLFLVVYLVAMQARASGAAAALTSGAFIAIITAFSQFLNATLNMGGALIEALEVIPYYERLRPLLEAEPESKRDTTHPGALSGALEVRHVSFRYNEQDPLVLTDVSMEVEAGQMVALVGPSGAGKSTLLRLLLGLERPETGTVYYDGQDLSTLDVEAVRRQIGTVLQDGDLTSGSIYKNIVGASTDLTMEDAWEAARRAGLEDDINQMPMGMETLVNEGGTTFSGGQRQRLMIARAIVHEPRILLFDEATSALDNKTQAAVSESLRQLHVTRIVIAHRLSTIRHADQIVVFEEGRIVERGEYDELMEKDGAFARLTRRQLIETDAPSA